MNIFEIFGSIAIDNTEANKALDETIKKAETLNVTLNKSGSGGSGINGSGNSGSNNSSNEKSGNKSVVIPSVKTSTSSIVAGNFLTDAITGLLFRLCFGVKGRATRSFTPLFILISYHTYAFFNILFPQVEGLLV